MATRNYTTKVTVEGSIARIQKTLRSEGVSEISERFDGQHTVGLSFVMKTPFGERRYHLPANIDGTLKALERDRKRGLVPPYLTTIQQARMVAWRNLEEWLAIQFAVVESGSVTRDEVMLPFMEVSPGQTVYDLALEEGLKIPALLEGERLKQLPSGRSA